MRTDFAFYKALLPELYGHFFILLKRQQLQYFTQIPISSTLFPGPFRGREKALAPADF